MDTFILKYNIIYFFQTKLSNINTTIYEPHLFLSFSKNFDRFVRDLTTFKNTVENIVSDASNDTIQGDVTYGSAWRHVENSYSEDTADTKLRQVHISQYKLKRCLRTLSFFFLES